MSAPQPPAPARPFEVADRVRVKATGETGSVAGVTANAATTTYDVLLDREPPLTLAFTADELERYTGPPVPLAPPGADPVHRALLRLNAALMRAVPEPLPELTQAFNALRDTIVAATPEEMDIDDGVGNGWRRCAPGCDLHVVRPGKVQCSGVRCGEAVQ